jgi:hypothetical protein
MARRFAELAMADGASTVEDRAQGMFARVMSRPATAEELARMTGFVRRAAELRSVQPPAADSARLPSNGGNHLADVLRCRPAWQDLAHALFNLKEFINVP